MFNNSQGIMVYYFRQRHTPLTNAINLKRMDRYIGKAMYRMWLTYLNIEIDNLYITLDDTLDGNSEIGVHVISAM